MQVGCKGLLQVELGVPAVLHLPQCLEVAQQDVTQPLGVDTGDAPLLRSLVLGPARPEDKDRTARVGKQDGHSDITPRKGNGGSAHTRP